MYFNTMTLNMYATRFNTIVWRINNKSMKLMVLSASAASAMLCSYLSVLRSIYMGWQQYKRSWVKACIKLILKRYRNFNSSKRGPVSSGPCPRSATGRLYCLTIIRLRLIEYCWIIRETMSRGYSIIFTEPEANNSFIITQVIIWKKVVN